MLRLFPVFVLALAVLTGGQDASAQTPGLKPFPLGGNAAVADSDVKISVSYQFFLEGDTSSMEEQAALADNGRKHLYGLLARECEVLLSTIAQTCAIERANVNSQLRDNGRRREGVRISGSATYRIALKPLGLGQAAPAPGTTAEQPSPQPR